MLTGTGGEPCPIKPSWGFPTPTVSQTAGNRWNPKDIMEFSFPDLAACLAHLLLEVSPIEK
jgi:hypothetical protein